MRTATVEADGLLESIRAGDPDALGTLYDLVGKRAYGLAFRVLRDAGSAEDAVQEAFLAVWRSADRLDGARGRLTSYVLTVVHRRAIDQARARQGRMARTATADPDDPEPATEDFVGAVLAAEDAGAIRRALEGLPPDQRQAIEMAYFEGLTYPEIAEALGAPLGTIKSRLRLGLGKLRTVLESQGYP
ncbi:MAG: sigma-70 family RNA polymerase sigma factor [Dehalococcoidia bacterium]